MNIGIAGNGLIVKELLSALSGSDEIRCAAIWGRSLEKVEALAERFSIAKVYPSYEEMLMDGDIDFIYIGLINSLHYSFAKQALLAGKNVIVEKPFVIELAQAEELIALAKMRKSFLFEAATVLYLDTFQFVKQHLDDIGEIKMALCNFSQFSSRYKRYMDGDIAPVFEPKCLGGAFYDLNIYNIHFITALFGLPENVRYFPNHGYNGVDTSGVLIMRYAKFSAVCVAAKDSSSQSFAAIQGDRGVIRVGSQVSLCASVTVESEGNSPLSMENNKNVLLNEFEKIAKIFSSKDWNACYSLMAQSANAARIFEQVSPYA